jgi:hypothetical protein
MTQLASRVALAGTLWLCTAASGGEPITTFWLEVVHASNEGDAVDPALAHMKEKFLKSGISYSSFHKLSSQSVSLTKGKSTELKLPNGRTAVVKLEEMKGQKALLRVTVPPVETVYELGREGSVFVRAGPHDKGVLILALSPVPAS